MISGTPGIDRCENGFGAWPEAAPQVQMPCPHRLAFAPERAAPGPVDTSAVGTNVCRQKGKLRERGVESSESHWTTDRAPNNMRVVSRSIRGSTHAPTCIAERDSGAWIVTRSLTPLSHSVGSPDPRILERDSQ
jgi:hypothetical protein